MSSSEDNSKKDGPQVAPAPPPPPEVAAQMESNDGSAGFDPRGSRLLLEVMIGLGVVFALGAAIVFAGGLIASWLTPLVPWSVDKTIGESAHEQMSESRKVCTNPEVQAYVENLAAPMLQAAGDLPFEFSFVVADTPEVNAFALPGGYVTVNRGLLEAAETGEEVAGVIGHEIQHALLRHGTKRILRQLGGAVLMNLVFGGSDLHGVSQAAARMTSLSYDRAQESEADEKGVELMVAAGIDPRGLSRFFQRLSENGARPPELLSTHPDPGTRSQLVNQAAVGVSFEQLPPPSDFPCHLE